MKCEDCKNYERRQERVQDFINWISIIKADPNSLLYIEPYKEFYTPYRIVVSEGSHNYYYYPHKGDL